MGRWCGRGRLPERGDRKEGLGQEYTLPGHDLTHRPPPGPHLQTHEAFKVILVLNHNKDLENRICRMVLPWKLALFAYFSCTGTQRLFSCSTTQRKDLERAESIENRKETGFVVKKGWCIYSNVKGYFYSSQLCLISRLALAQWILLSSPLHLTLIPLVDFLCLSQKVSVPSQRLCGKYSLKHGSCADANHLYRINLSF